MAMPMRWLLTSVRRAEADRRHQAPHVAAARQPLSETRNPNMQPTVLERPAFTVVGLEAIFREGEDGYAELWQRFIPRENEVTGKIDPIVSYGVCIPQADRTLRYITGFEVDEGAIIPDGMTRFRVPAQRYAVFTHTGTAAGISASFQAIHDHLLAENGLQAEDGVDLERYDARFLDPFDPTAQMELHIPIH